MTEFEADIPSTVIDNEAPAPGSAEFRPDPEPIAPKDEAKPMSLDDAMKQAVEDTKVDEKAKPEPKPEKVKTEDAKPEPKEKPAPERGENGKFTAKPKAEPEPSEASQPEDDGGEVGQEQKDQRPSEGRDINRAPAHFLPRAKEQWATVPPDVKSEVYRALDNFENGKKEYEADRAFRKELTQFEEMATKSNTTIPRVLQEYVSIANQLRQEPAAAVERLLATVGITPKQYAEYAIGMEQYHAANPGAKEASALQQQVQQLQQQVQQLTQGTEEQRKAAYEQQVQANIIAPFAATHPRFEELQDDIALFLNSGKIPSNLSEQERLEQAYDMAERINPEGRYVEDEPLNPAPNAQRPLNPAGSKSVKGSKSYGAEAPRKSAKLSLDESIKAAMAQSRF